MRLDRDFFNRSTLQVAPDLLGKILVCQHQNKLQQAIISEVEAYLGPEDLASHAAAKTGQRGRIFWQAGGTAYVYLIYGMHYCFNVVTEAVGVPGAILVRAIVPVAGFTQLKQIEGPGRVCKSLQISFAENGIDTVTSEELWFEDWGLLQPSFETLPRVGITKAVADLWRFKVTKIPPEWEGLSPPAV